MFAIRLSLTCLATLTMALTTFVTVTPQPVSAGTVACAERPEPVRA